MFFRRPPLFALRASPMRIATRAFNVRPGRFAGLGTIVPGMPLSMGANGEDVRAVQDRLLFLGFQVSVDGVFGIALQKAIRQFQSENNLGTTGNIDHYLWEKLDAVARAKGYKPAALTKDFTQEQNVFDINIDGKVKTLVQNGVATGEKPWTAEEGGFTDFNYNGGRDPRVPVTDEELAAKAETMKSALEDGGSSKLPYIIGGGVLLIGAFVLLSKKR